MINVITVIGKANFRSEKKNQDYYVLHTYCKKDSVEGYAVDAKFVSADIFNSVSINGKYEVIYGCYDNGRAYIADMKPVANE